VDNLERTLREAMSLPAEQLFEMGQRASELIAERFDYRSVAKKTKQLYEELI
jgi:glycosyltransferase involved in cell wall biosynthesis